MTLDINIELLKKELNESSHSLILKETHLKKKLEKKDIYDILLFLINIIQDNKKSSHKDIYQIQTIEDFLKIISIDYLETIQDISTEKKLLALLVFITLRFTKFSHNSFNFLLISLELVEELEKYSQSINRFSDSIDYRGLYYWLCSEIIGKNYYDQTESLLKYEYNPPKITPQWLSRYRKEKDPMEFWFYNSSIGNGLFLILYTPKCRYAKCSGCNLPSLSSQSKTTSPSAVYTQVDTVLQHSLSHQEKESIKEIILSNNGNLFDIKTMPTLSLLYTINALIEELPSLEKIVIESRIEYLNEHQLKTINELLSAHEDRNIKIEIALGFEIFDDEIRNGYYQKGFYKSALEKLMPLFSKYDVSLKFYMMYKAVPNMSTQEAIDDMNNVSKYAHELIKTYDVNINIHISPTYVAVGTLLEKEFNDGNYTPPGPKEVDMLCQQLAIFDNVSYYISLNDEGLSSTHIEEEYTLFLDLKSRIDYFNSYQKWETKEVKVKL